MHKTFFNSDDIAHMLERTDTSNFPERDALLILFSSVLGLTRQEISGLKIADIMEINGQWKSRWQVNKAFAYKGIERVVYTPKKMVRYLDQYIEWLEQMGLKNGPANEYMGFRPDFIFIRNDNKNPFSLLKRNHNRAEGLVSYHTRALDDKFEAILNNSNLIGSTPSAFRDGYIMSLYGEGLSLPDIMTLTGFKTRHALKTKIARLAVSKTSVNEILLEKVTKKRQ